jgi:membrane protein required for colicin V production
MPDMHIVMIDVILLGLILLSALISLLRGFTKEFFSLLVWVLTALAVWKGTGPLMPLVEGTLNIEDNMVSGLIAACGIFLACVVMGSLGQAILGRLVSKQVLGFPDRFLGMVFGCARGWVVAVLLAGILASTPLRDPLWEGAFLAPRAEWFAHWVMDKLNIEVDMTRLGA